MYYVYILYSDKDGKLYTGYTQNLKQRFEQHEHWLVRSTKHRRPLRLIFYEAFISKQDAMHRERYLKTSYGKRVIKSMLKSYFTENW